MDSAKPAGEKPPGKPRPLGPSGRKAGGIPLIESPAAPAALSSGAQCTPGRCIWQKSPRSRRGSSTSPTTREAFRGSCTGGRRGASRTEASLGRGGRPGSRWTGAAPDRGSGCGAPDRLVEAGPPVRGPETGKRARAAFPARGPGPAVPAQGQRLPAGAQGPLPCGGAGAAAAPWAVCWAALAALGRGALGGGRGRPAAGLLLAGGAAQWCAERSPALPGARGPPLGGRVGWCWGPATCWPQGQVLILSRRGGAAGTAGPGFPAAGRRAPGLFPAFFLPGHLF